MAAKKKTTKKAAKKAPARKASAAPASGEDQAATLRRIEERLAALEARAHEHSAGQESGTGASGGETARELRELRLSLLPTLETYRNNASARSRFGAQMPSVLAGTILVILILVSVLAWNGVLSGDAAVILITGTLVYAAIQLRNYLLD